MFSKFSCERKKLYHPKTKNTEYFLLLKHQKFIFQNLQAIEALSIYKNAKI